MKYLKKFIESVDINNKVDYDDLQIISGFAENLEYILFDELGIEISRSEVKRFTDDNSYFVSMGIRTPEYIIPMDLEKDQKENDVVITALFKIKTKINIKKINHIVERYFNERLKSSGFKYKDTITEWGDIYIYYYTIEY